MIVASPRRDEAGRLNEKTRMQFQVHRHCHANPVSHDFLHGPSAVRKKIVPRSSVFGSLAQLDKMF
jgi:hypothetical protein